MKTRSYVEFYDHLQASARQQKRPLRVMFELTYRCNFRCGHCYVPPSYQKAYANRELSTAQVFHILEQLKDAGCFFLGFTGGEPMLRSDIFKILARARELGFEVILYTNGSLVDRRAADFFKAWGINKVDVTLPGVTRPVFEGVTAVRGSFKRVFQGLELLKKNKAHLGLKTCIVRVNKPQEKDIRRFGKTLGVAHRVVASLFPRLDGSRVPLRFMAPESVSQRLEADLCFDPRTPRREKTDLFKCGVGCTQAAITPAGELKMCVSIDYPRIPVLRSTLADAWARLTKMVSLIKPGKGYHCDICRLRDHCYGCPATSWLYDKTFTSCPPYVHQEAQNAFFARR